MADRMSQSPDEHPRRIVIPASKILEMCHLVGGQITWASARVNEVEFEVTAPAE
jgi:hypothetical protein